MLELSFLSLGKAKGQSISHRIGGNTDNVKIRRLCIKEVKRNYRKEEEEAPS